MLPIYGRLRLFLAFIVLIWIMSQPVAALAEHPSTVQSPSPELVKRLDLDSKFYRKWLDADGLPILASQHVSDFALLEAKWIIDHMLDGRDDLRRAIVSKPIRLVIMSPNEMTTDIPEHSDLTPAAYWDRRARGLGATDQRPAVSTGEENLLEYPGDPYHQENILVHEFAHVIHQHGLAGLDPDFDNQLQRLFDQARSEKLWEGKYAGTNPSEYFAESVQSWFGTNRENDYEHNHVDTREELQQHDPRMGALLASIFGDNAWTYVAPSKRVAETPHLEGFDRATSPEFRWSAKVNEAFKAHQDNHPKLENQVAEDWSGLRSDRNANKVSVTFHNQTSEALSVYWIDFEGERQPYGMVDPGREKRQSTFEGHRWELETELGKLLGRFVAPAVASIAVVHPDRLAKLENQRTDDWSGVRSDRTRKKVRVTFHNQTSEALSVYWIDFEGLRKPYGMIEPGRKKRQGTFEGHRWELESASGQILGRFVATAIASVAEVSSDR